MIGQLAVELAALADVVEHQHRAADIARGHRGSARRCSRRTARCRRAGSSASGGRDLIGRMRRMEPVSGFSSGSQVSSWKARNTSSTLRPMRVLEAPAGQLSRPPD